MVLAIRADGGGAHTRQSSWDLAQGGVSVEGGSKRYVAPSVMVPYPEQPASPQECVAVGCPWVGCSSFTISHEKSIERKVQDEVN